jgi:two-component system chemotaxis response regulator CheY
MRVLVAEDEASHRQRVVSALEEQGCRVEVAGDGLEAWRILKREDIRLVVTDWMMPRMSGLDLLRHIRSDRLRHYVYVIMLTGRRAQDDVIRGLGGGADDYMTKPFDPRELTLRLRVGQRLLRIRDGITVENERLRKEAFLDALTVARNRRAFDDDHARIHAEAERYGNPYSLAMIDIDHFKSYNDTLGHQEGDLALKYVARLLISNARTSDSVYRYGGDEFAWLLTQTDARHALRGADRMRRLVEDDRVPHPANDPYNIVTISIGLASHEPGKRASAAAVLERADAALYRAKGDGRNRVVAIEKETLDFPTPDRDSERLRGRKR